FFDRPVLAARPPSSLGQVLDIPMTNSAAESIPSTFDDGELYDLMLGEMPYGRDFYVGLARESSGPVLDVACGTGRILLPCLEAGVDIEGVDLYQPMLDTL